MNNSLTKNAFFNVLYKFLYVIFPLITISYASRILGVWGIGSISSVQNIVTYFTMFASLGIPSYGIRAIAKSRKNSENLNKTFSELFLINSISTIVSFVIYIVYVFFCIEAKNLSLIFSTLIIFNLINIEWAYQGIEEYQYIATRSFIVKCLSLLGLIIFVRSKEDLNVYAIIVCAGIIGNYILNIITIRKHIKFSFKNLNIIQHLKPIFIFWASVIAIEIYSLLDITMLSHIDSIESVGYYSNASKIVKTIANSVTAFGAVLLPRLSLYYAENDNKKIAETLNKFLKIVLFISIPMMIGIIMVSKEVIFVLFGNEFVNSILTLKILSLLIICMPLSGGIFGQLLLTTNKENKYLICVSVGAMINFILNYFFISNYSHYGAAIATIITEIVVTLLMIIFSKDDIKIQIEPKFILTILCGILCMAIIICYIDYIDISNYIYSLVIKVFGGCFCYFITLVILKNDIMLWIINIIKNKKRE